MKWFPNTNGTHEDVRREPAVPAYQFDSSMERPKKSSHARLSSTFSDSRPWHLISRSQPSDMNNGSSRKRRSLFGLRDLSRPSTPTTESSYSSGPASPFESSSSHNSVSRKSGLGPSRPAQPMTQTPRASMSMENWRSSMFLRTKSGRLPNFEEWEREPVSQRSRYGGKASGMRASMDFLRRQGEPEDTYGRKIEKSTISQPFNFQHITHTQKHQLPEIELVTDQELVSEFWAATNYQDAQHELRGISAQTIEKDDPQWAETVRKRDSTDMSDTFSFKRGPLAGMATQDTNLSYPSSETTPEANTVVPLTESRRSSHQDARSQSFGLTRMSSTERLATIGSEQRDHPAMLHPAFRPSSASSTPIYELPAMNLDSVPEEIEQSSPPRPATSQRNSKFMPFPVGNAFAIAHGGVGAEIEESASNRLSFNGEDSVPSLTSGESWENEVDLLYLVEAESTCDFDWGSIKSSRKGSVVSQHRRDSTTDSSVRTPSVPDARSARSSVHKVSNRSNLDDADFAGFDGAYPVGAALSKQKLSPTAPHDPTINVATVLSTTVTNPGQKDVLGGDNSSSETMVETSRGKHGRSASYSCQRPEPAKKTARWSVASPLYLPEDARTRQASFSTTLTESVVKYSMFSPPTMPPPAMPLPVLPTELTTGLISPPQSPPNQSMPDFNYRRPDNERERMLLQAAGRTVQRGRYARPSTPSRLSNVQFAKDTSPRAIPPRPTTPSKAGSVGYKLSLFPTPPSSPPHLSREYPAWI